MKNCLNKNLKKKKIILILVIIIIGWLSILVKPIFALDAETLGSMALQGVGLAISAVLGFIALLITSVVGLLITLAIKVLISIAQFNNIIGVETVVNGWVIIRDLCNMFFILILLVIAFATILRVESYNYKKLLPKLLIMAILINFSRTICGLIIDFAQVIMLTFANGFSEGSGHFIQMFNTQFLGQLDIKVNSSKAFNNWDTAVASIAGVIAAIITLIVLLVIIAVLVIRIIMLWIYVVLSPLAFLAAAFPAGQKYASRWWSEFTKYVVSGPILAFFIWLALTTVKKSADTLMQGQTSDLCGGVSMFFCNVEFTKFILAIGFLAGGLMITQQAGEGIGRVAGKGLDWTKKVASVPHRGLKVLRDYPIDKLQHRGIVDLNLVRLWKGIKEKRADIKKKQYGEGMVAAAEKMREKGRFRGLLAMTATPGSAFEQLTTKAGWKRRAMGGKYAKDKIKDLAETRDKAKTDIKNIQNSIRYNDAKEISESLAPTERLNLENEQTQLTQEIEQLNNEIKSLAAEIKTAKNNNDFMAEKTATEKSDNLKNQLELKLTTFDANKKTLDQTPRTDSEIEAAKKFREKVEIKISQKEGIISSVNDQILDYKPIVDFEAIAMQGALEAEEMKKVDHIKDRDELTSMLRDAMKSGNKTRFSAIALKLAKDGNENDGVLNSLGFDSNAEGLQDMIKSISSKQYENNKGKTVTKEENRNYMGFSDQAAKALGMKISYAAEAANHWGTARAFTMEDGRYRDSSKYEQAIAAASEIAKMDPQQINIRLNRMGYGGETPDGKFILNEFGLALLKAVGPKMAEQMNRFNPNAAARLSTPENIKLMVEVGVAPEFISKLQAKGKTPIIKVDTAIDELKKIKIDGKNKYFPEKKTKKLKI